MKKLVVGYGQIMSTSLPLAPDVTFMATSYGFGSVLYRHVTGNAKFALQCLPLGVHHKMEKQQTAMCLVLIWMLNNRNPFSQLKKFVLHPKYSYRPVYF
jgi:hypothetical protein